MYALLLLISVTGIIFRLNDNIVFELWLFRKCSHLAL